MGIIRRYQSIIYGNYKKKILKYGILSGLGLITIVILRYAMVFPIKTVSSWIDNVVLFGCMIAFTYLYRKDNPSKKITFKEAYLLSLGIGIAAAFIYAVFLWFYVSFIDVQFVENYYQVLTEHTPDKTKPFLIESLSFQLNAAVQAFVGIGIVCIILALFSGVIMRTEKAPIKEKKKK